MKIIKSVISALLAVVLFAGCSAPSTIKDDSGLNVVASFAPVYALTLALTDGTSGINVSCMAANSTGCLHDYQITADDMKSVDKADIYVIGGAGMEGSFLDKITATYPNLTIADSSSGITLIANEDEGYNSHIWLSTFNAAVMAKNIAGALSAASPENSEIINANLTKFTDEMNAIHDKYADSFAALSHRSIITFHEAFEYLAEEFGIEVKAVIETEPGTVPDPQTLNELIATVNSGDVSAVFTEPQYPDDTAQVISRETGVGVYSLDPIVTGEMSKSSFSDKLDGDLKILLSALNK